MTTYPSIQNTHLHPEWLASAQQRELLLAQRNHAAIQLQCSQSATTANWYTHVAVQNQGNKRPCKWDRTGQITEVLPHHQYQVRMDGSGRITLRNRRFIRVYTAIKPPNIYPSAMPNSATNQIHVEPANNGTTMVTMPIDNQPEATIPSNPPKISGALQRLASSNNPGLLKTEPTSRTRKR